MTFPESCLFWVVVALATLAQVIKAALMAQAMYHAFRPKPATITIMIPIPAHHKGEV